MVRYCVYCLSVLLCVGQFAKPASPLRHFLASYYASCSFCITDASLDDGGPDCVGLVPRGVAATRTSCSRAGFLDSLRAGIAFAADGLEPLVAARAPGWLAYSPLPFLVARRRRASKLPASVTEHPRRASDQARSAAVPQLSWVSRMRVPTQQGGRGSEFWRAGAARRWSRGRRPRRATRRSSCVSSERC